MKRLTLISLGLVIGLLTSLLPLSFAQQNSGQPPSPVQFTKALKKVAKKFSENKTKKSKIELAAENKYMLYYDFRASNKLCLTRMEAQRRQLGVTSMIRACSEKDLRKYKHY